MSRVVHFEIHAENPERAVEFYEGAFAWKFQKWDGPQDYWLISTGEPSERGIDGGMIRRQGKIDGTAVIGYVCTVDVSNADDSAGKITALGGTIVVPKMAIPSVGWLVYCKDTEGNIFGILQRDPEAK
jgi:hypothetical protein